MTRAAQQRKRTTKNAGVPKEIIELARQESRPGPEQQPPGRPQLDVQGLFTLLGHKEFDLYQARGQLVTLKDVLLQQQGKIKELEAKLTGDDKTEGEEGKSEAKPEKGS